MNMNRPDDSTRLHCARLQALACCHVAGAADEPAADIRDLRSATNLQQIRPTRLPTPRVQDSRDSSTITTTTTAGKAVVRTHTPPGAHQDDDGAAHEAVCVAPRTHRRQALEETRDG